MDRNSQSPERKFKSQHFKSSFSIESLIGDKQGSSESQKFTPETEIQNFFHPPFHPPGHPCYPGSQGGYKSTLRVSEKSFPVIERSDNFLHPLFVQKLEVERPFHFHRPGNFTSKFQNFYCSKSNPSSSSSSELLQASRVAFPPIQVKSTADCIRASHSRNFLTDFHRQEREPRNDSFERIFGKYKHFDEVCGKPVSTDKEPQTGEHSSRGSEKPYGTCKNIQVLENVAGESVDSQEFIRVAKNDVVSFSLTGTSIRAFKRFKDQSQDRSSNNHPCQHQTLSRYPQPVIPIRGEFFQSEIRCVINGKDPIDEEECSPHDHTTQSPQNVNVNQPEKVGTVDPAGNSSSTPEQDELQQRGRIQNPSDCTEAIFKATLYRVFPTMHKKRLSRKMSAFYNSIMGPSRPGSGYPVASDDSTRGFEGVNCGIMQSTPKEQDRKRQEEQNRDNPAIGMILIILMSLS